MSSGNSDLPTDFASGQMPDVGNNSYNFSTGLGNIDPNAGLNSLNAGLVGPGAGTMPNGFVPSSSNYLPDSSGVSAGALNGNTSFSMPGNSMGQLLSQSQVGKLSQAMGMGGRLIQPQDDDGGRLQTGSGKVRLPQVTFANPITSFAGSVGGSQAGNSLIEMLSKYHPGATR